MAVQQNAQSTSVTSWAEGAAEQAVSWATRRPTRDGSQPSSERASLFLLVWMKRVGDWVSDLLTDRVTD